MSTPRLPFAEIEVPCTTCGRMVLQAKRRVGRHSRFCSVECKRQAKVIWNARWRARHPEYPRDAYLRRKAAEVAEKAVEELVGTDAPTNFSGASFAGKIFGRQEEKTFDEAGGGGSKVCKSVAAEPALPSLTDFFAAEEILEPIEGGSNEAKRRKTWVLIARTSQVCHNIFHRGGILSQSCHAHVSAHQLHNAIAWMNCLQM